MNGFPRDRFKVIDQRNARSTQAQQQAPDLAQALRRAINAGRRRGHGLRGKCISCGRPLRSHRNARNEQRTCEAA